MAEARLSVVGAVPHALSIMTLLSDMVICIALTRRWLAWKASRNCRGCVRAGMWCCIAHQSNLGVPCTRQGLVAPESDCVRCQPHSASHNRVTVSPDCGRATCCVCCSSLVHCSLSTTPMDWHVRALYTWDLVECVPSARFSAFIKNNHCSVSVVAHRGLPPSLTYHYLARSWQTCSRRHDPHPQATEPRYTTQP